MGVSAPALTQLEEIAADIAGVKGSWVVYQEFLAERDELAHKDWLSMRDQVRMQPNSRLKGLVDCGLVSLPAIALHLSKASLAVIDIDGRP